MKILHAGWGFLPFRKGGLIEYAEDLMQIQVQKGYEVSYFCTGRHNIFLPSSTLKKWKHDKGYQVFELMNPPIVTGLDFGMDQPRLDYSDKQTQDVFLAVVADVKPQIVHFQELLGLPTALLSTLKALGILTVYTAEDYFPLCPTLKLVTYERQLCSIKGPELGKVCAVCCREAPINNVLYKLKSTYKIFKNPFWRQLMPSFLKWHPALYAFLTKRKQSAGDLLPRGLEERKALKVHEFNERRLQNLQNLTSCDLIIAMSTRVKEIFTYYHPFTNIITLNLTLNHISWLLPNKIEPKANEHLVLGVINAMGTYSKGRDLLFELFELISATSLADKITLNVLGDVFGDTPSRLKAYKFIHYRGTYKTKNLNDLLESLKIQVGLVPSVWEEAYAYVGIEFLAKGIPVIGNQIGGITDYLFNDETGWLNPGCTAQGIYQIIANLVKDPSQIVHVNRNLISNRSKYIKTLDVHFNEMDHLYTNLIAGGLTHETPSRNALN